LLADTMARSAKVAVARFVMRGKENLVLIRAAQGGLMLHTMYFADEVRNFGEIDKEQSAIIKASEVDLALQLVNGLARDDFNPEDYRDEYRRRVMAMIEEKVAGAAAEKKRLAKAKPTPAARRAEAAPRRAQAGRK
jgi:DNA end-binding protein Ku